MNLAKALNKPPWKPATAADAGMLWVVTHADPPSPYIIESFQEAGESARSLMWLYPEDGSRPFGKIIRLGRRGNSQQYSMTVNLVSPALALALAMAPEDVVVVRELNLVALYAGLSRYLHRRRVVIALIEGDYQYLGATGTIPVKVRFRKLVSRFVDVFVANSEAARSYLRRVLDVTDDRIVVGWWLAGLPSNLPAVKPTSEFLHRSDGPVFLTAGQLIPRKGIDLLLSGVAEYKRAYGHCSLWVIGTGPELPVLVQQADKLGLSDSVTFLGEVEHGVFKGALQACDSFVFPTLQDLVGRVVVEALSAGVPVVLSDRSGASGTLVQHGVNGLVVDARDTTALAIAMHNSIDPATNARLRQGARNCSDRLAPEAAAAVVRQAAELARARLR